MRFAQHLFILAFLAWATATPAGIVGTGLRGGSALLNVAGVMVFAIPFCLPSLLFGVAAYFIARRAGAQPLLYGAITVICTNIFAFYEVMKFVP